MYDHTELGAGDMCPYPHEAQSLVERAGDNSRKQLKIHTSKVWARPGRKE